MTRASGRTVRIASRQACRSPVQVRGEIGLGQDDHRGIVEQHRVLGPACLRPPRRRAERSCGFPRGRRPQGRPGFRRSRSGATACQRRQRLRGFGQPGLRPGDKKRAFRSAELAHRSSPGAGRPLSVCWSPTITAQGSLSLSKASVFSSKVVLPLPGDEIMLTAVIPRSASQLRFRAAAASLRARTRDSSSIVRDSAELSCRRRRWCPRDSDGGECECAHRRAGPGR